MSLSTPSPNVCKLVFSLNNLFSLSAASIMFLVHHNWHRPPVSCFCSDSTSTVMISSHDVLLSRTKPPPAVVGTASTNNMQPSEITSEEELLLYILQYGIVHCNTIVGQHLILTTSTMPLNTHSLFLLQL